MRHIWFPNVGIQLIRLNEKSKVAVMRVAPHLGKMDIKNYLEQVYNVKVNNITTKNVEGKMKSIEPYSKKMYQTRSFKKATVELAEKHAYEFPPIPKDKPPQKAPIKK